MKSSIRPNWGFERHGFKLPFQITIAAWAVFLGCCTGAFIRGCAWVAPEYHPVTIVRNAGSTNVFINLSGAAQLTPRKP